LTQNILPVKTKLLIAKRFLIPALFYGVELIDSTDAGSQRKLKVFFKYFKIFVVGCFLLNAISRNKFI